MYFTSKYSLLILLFFLCSFPALLAEDSKYLRGRMEDILDVVADDVQHNFYDPKLKGLDWKALRAQAHQQIRQSQHIGEMISAISGLLYQLNDSHTIFIPPGRTEHAVYGFKAKPFGEDVYVYEVKKDGPAAKAGLELGDKVVGLNQFNVKRERFFDLMFYLEVLNPNMELDLTVLRNGAEKMIRIPTKLELHSPSFFGDFLQWRYKEPEELYSHKDYEGNVGYIKLRTFMTYPERLMPMMGKVKSSAAVILDLRNNGGGSEDALAFLSGYFTEEPFDLLMKVSRDRSEPLRVKPHSSIKAPLFVMVDSASASAAEVFARALQLRRRAVIIGDKSSGRVNRASLFWEKVGAFDFTPFGTEIAVSKGVLPNGEELENRGVTPDVLCIPNADDLHNEKDPCLDRAIDLARKTIVENSTSANPTVSQSH
jgi:C-terminal processing protease CtpA/Prc